MELYSDRVLRMLITKDSRSETYTRAEEFDTEIKKRKETCETEEQIQDWEAYEIVVAKMLLSQEHRDYNARMDTHTRNLYGSGRHSGSNEKLSISDTKIIVEAMPKFDGALSQWAVYKRAVEKTLVTNDDLNQLVKGAFISMTMKPEPLL